jgi:hypothetical protein
MNADDDLVVNGPVIKQRRFHGVIATTTPLASPLAPRGSTSTAARSGSGRHPGNGHVRPETKIGKTFGFSP